MLNRLSRLGASFLGVCSLLVLSCSNAFAAIPKDVTDALNAAKVDGVTVAGLVLVVIISIMAFKYVRKAL